MPALKRNDGSIAWSVLWTRWILVAQLMVSGACVHARTGADNCVQTAASYHGVNPALLLAVLSVESGLNQDAVRRNRNGSYDIGIGQINSVHLPELKYYGVGVGQLLNACQGTYVSAWLLRRGIDRYGETWFGAASYHSVTPLHNQRYQQRLKVELMRKGLHPDSVWAP